MPPNLLGPDKRPVAWQVVRQDPRFLPMRSMFLLTLLLLIVAGLFLYGRSRLVGGAPLTIVWEGWQMHLVWILYPMGITLHGVTPEAVYLIWLGTVGFLVGVNLFMASPGSRRMTIYWLICVIITTAHGLVEARGNLLLIPSTIFSFGIVWMLGNVAKSSRPAFVFGGLVVLSVLISSAVHSRIAQEAAHPLSLNYLQGNSNFLWGGKYSHAHVPPVRLEYLRRLFASLGITSREEFENFYSAAEKQAEDKNSPTSPAEGKPFWPRIDFMQP